MALTTGQHPKGLSAFADDLQAAGRYTFLTGEARAALGGSEVALANAARRLKGRGRIAAPRRGFHVIVPAEYRATGAPPPSWFIDDLMRYLVSPTTWVCCLRRRCTVLPISSRWCSRS